MSAPPARDQRQLRYRSLADPTRRRLLRILDDVPEPVDIATLAGQVGLHPNTVRDHLALLQEAGLVERTSEERSRPGRPRALYRSAPRETRAPGSEGYRFLAEVLASSIRGSSDDPAGIAEEAGRAWGRYLVDRPVPFAPIDADRVVDQVLTALAGLGFSSEDHRQGEVTVLRVHDCPFRSLARGHGEIVCSVHRGLLRGMIAEMGGGLEVTDFRPMAEPSLCIAEISRLEGS